MTRFAHYGVNGGTGNGCQILLATTRKLCDGESMQSEVQESNFAFQLKSLRRDHGLTQKDVSSLIGYSLSSIEHWEEGIGGPSKLVQEAILRRIKAVRRKKI